jgi:hypothetical protein
LDLQPTTTSKLKATIEIDEKYFMPIGYRIKYSKSNRGIGFCINQAIEITADLLHDILSTFFATIKEQIFIGAKCRMES